MSEIVWRTSTRSGGNGGTCVEVATLNDRVLVRDSKNREGGVLTFMSDEWRAFTEAVHRGRYDLGE